MGLELVLGAAAITLLFVLGSIFKPLREHGPKLWRELVTCPLCLGFWLGIGAILVFEGRPHDLKSLCVVLAGGAVSAFVALLCRQVSDLLAELAYLVDQLSQNLKLTREQQESQAERVRQVFRARAEANEPCAEHKCPKVVCQVYHQHSEPSRRLVVRDEKLHGIEPKPEAEVEPEKPEQPAQAPR